MAEVDTRPLIVIRESTVGSFTANIQKEAESYGWRLLNIEATYNMLLSGVNPDGALISVGLGVVHDLWSVLGLA